MGEGGGGGGARGGVGVGGLKHSAPTPPRPTNPIPPHPSHFLTHLCLASHTRDIGKQCGPRSDAADISTNMKIIIIIIK